MIVEIDQTHGIQVGTGFQSVPIYVCGNLAVTLIDIGRIVVMRAVFSLL